MKKTLCILLTLGCVAVATADTSTSSFEFTGPESSVNLDKTYDLTKNWTLEFSCLLTPAVSADDLGTAIISSEENPTAATQKIQLFASKDGDKVVVRADNSDDSYNITGLTGTAWSYASFSGAITFTLNYIAENKSLTLSMSLPEASWTETETFSGIVYDEGATLSSLSTGITQVQLDTKNYEIYDTWTPPTGSFTGTVASPSVPEPTTATLSLLALAGLAARRRRK